MAIARAFIKHPKILIFDEATSALDKRNEQEVQQSIDAIRKELGQVTTIVIAHRLSTIRNADNILVLKKGRLVEQGDHHKLLKEHPTGIYSMLVRQQEQVDDQAAGADSSFSEAGTDDANDVSHDKAQIAYSHGHVTGSVKKDLDRVEAPPAAQVPFA